MTNRRNFIASSALAGIGFPSLVEKLSEWTDHDSKKSGGPLVLATWKNTKAVEAAWNTLQQGKSALDAAESGAMVPEADPEDTSVGYGGFPDRDGHVTLDACIMDEKGNAGSVVFLQHIMHPVSVARLVMEQTPHVLLAGEGALQFALENGFNKENLLTPKARKALDEWLMKSEYKPKINSERHDTIGILCMDPHSNLSGACSTSGLAFKRHGRVGDSPIIGAGLYVDNQVGAATATGLGEAVMKKVGAFSIVEMMRNGMHPQKACKEAIKRLTSIQAADPFQVGYIAVNVKGEFGAFSLLPGFQATVHSKHGLTVLDAEHLLDH